MEMVQVRHHVGRQDGDDDANLFELGAGPDRPHGGAATRAHAGPEASREDQVRAWRSKIAQIVWRKLAPCTGLVSRHSALRSPLATWSPTTVRPPPAAVTSCAGPKPCGGGMLGVLNTRWAFPAMAAPWSWKVLGRSRRSHRRGGPLIYSIDYRAGGACRPRSAVLLRREKTSKDPNI